ncbi:hypothetical protein ACFWJ5_05330 [Streptomyces qaidamensis]|uniref:hypothetical protein n=1 Tax=Streptomyces qaidamensis TaxID=1783515 RepID=UPI00364764EE
MAYSCGCWASDDGLSVVSPVVMRLLLTRSSGQRLLERLMADRPGSAEYRARTTGFFPRPPTRRGRA